MLENQQQDTGSPVQGDLLTSEERQTVVLMFNSADRCIQNKALTIMCMTVNSNNIRQFVDDMITRALPRPNAQNRQNQAR